MALLSLRDKTLWVNPNSSAKQQADAWRTSNPSGAKIFDVLAKIPSANWIGDWSSAGSIDSILNKAAGQLVTFVAYNIPDRDLGSASAGGAASIANYKTWVDTMASGIKNRQCILVLEPDACAMINQMSSAGRAGRYECLNYAVDKFTAAGCLVMIDAADSGWSNPTTMSSVLVQAGVLRARGFTTNCAHFRTVKNEHIYATAICEKIKQEHGVELRYIIDSGRCGQGPYDVKPGQDSKIGWMNPPNAGIGPRPTLKLSTVAYPYCDGLLFIKGWSSDGPREGQPKAGEAFPEQVLRMYWAAKPPFAPIQF